MQDEVPDAERLLLIGLRAAHMEVIVPLLTVPVIVVAVVRNAVAVEHIEVVVAPEHCAPARVLVCNAEVDLVLRPVEQATRHRRIALVDCMEVGIANLRRPMTVKAVVVLRLKPRDLRPPNVLKAIDHISRRPPFSIT